MKSMRVLASLFFAVLAAVSASAQSNVTTTGGTANAVPKFSGTTTVVNSAITENGGNVGIGTTTPGRPLTVNGVADVSQLYTTGNNSYNSSNPFAGDIVVGSVEGTRHDSSAMFWSLNSASRIFNQADNFYLSVWNQDAVTGANVKLSATSGGSSYFLGNVGIGTNAPAAKLEVNGNVKLTAGSGASLTFSDGTAQSTAFTGVLCGGDYAESVEVSGDRKQYEPGDVLVIDPDNSEGFAKSAMPYSTGVAGIYSTKPGVIGRRSTDPDRIQAEIPMAMVGIVPTKVSAENGPIKRGDLLVTSATVGFAMKGTDRGKMFGAVVGKAMGSLDSGTGVIEVLVTLQ